MIQSDKASFIALIAGLAETYGRPLSKAGLTAYWLGLRDLELEQVSAAAGVALQNGNFMPTVAELRASAGIETNSSRAIKAWGAVCEAAGRIGSYRSVNFQDQLINAVVRSMGGWPELLSKTGDEFDKWARMEFIKCYQALSASVSSDSEQCRPLSGLQTQDIQPCFVSVEYQVPKKLLSSNPVRQITHEGSK